MLDVAKNELFDFFFYFWLVRGFNKNSSLKKNRTEICGNYFMFTVKKFFVLNQFYTSICLQFCISAISSSQTPRISFVDYVISNTS